MTSTFFGLNIAVSALMAQQRALDITAHNVANANTEGYTRQDAHMVAADPFPVPTASIAGQAGQLGTGVIVKEIRRMRDQFLDSQVRSQVGSLGYWQTKQDYLAQIEALFNEPSDQGINSLLTKFWGAWQDLAASPKDYAARVALVQSGTLLADVIQRDYKQMVALQKQADTEIDSKLVEVNGWLKDVAELNKRIGAVEVQVASDLDPKVLVHQDQANDLRDRRDLVLDNLARAVGVSYQEQDDGTVTVWLPGSGGTQQTLVQGGTVNGLSYGKVALPAPNSAYSIGHVYWNDPSNPPTNPDAGIGESELKGLLETRNVTLNPSSAALAALSPGYGNPDFGQSFTWRLDQLASQLITLVNDGTPPSNLGHTTGYNLVDTTPRVFFGSADATPSTGAADIRVNPNLGTNPNLVAAASAPGQDGDGQRANDIADALRDTKVSIVSDTLGATVTASLNDWYRAMIAKLGVDGQQANDMVTNQKSLVDRLTKNRESFSGVSLDEEAANVVRFERAFQAAARVMNAMDEMLDKLVNSVGIVGR